MSDSPGIIIFGSASDVTASGVDTLGLSRVSPAALQANLKAIMADLGDLVRAARDAVGDVEIAHIDIQLGIAVDGSVGLLGNGVRAGANGTFTVRLTH